VKHKSKKRKSASRQLDAIDVTDSFPSRAPHIDGVELIPFGEGMQLPSKRTLGIVAGIGVVSLLVYLLTRKA
jgi:hypothetical protein